MRNLIQTAMAAGLLLAGCGDTTNTDGSVVLDMAMGTKDLTMPATADMTAPLDMTVPPDMAKLIPSGTAVLTDISATVIIQNAPVQVRVIAPLVGFSVGAKHDFTNMGVAGGCQGDHYTAAKKPTPDVDSGTITFTGFTGGKFLDTTTAPNKISCAIVSGFYKCSYGDLVNGAPGPMQADQTPYGQNATPIDPTDTITMAGTGGTAVGAWSGTAAAKDALKTMDDISTIKFDPTADYNLKFTCPTETMAKCGFTVAGVSISFSDQTPQNYLNPPTNSGNVTCFGLAGGGALIINKEAIAAAEGCDNTGNNCDQTLLSKRVIAVRIDLPGSAMDPNGAKITTAAGRGDSAISAK